MNYLAHLALSPDTPTRIGNFIGDHVKGRKYEALPFEIATGVLLHRKIDMFTDKHPLIRQGVDRFRPAIGRYAPVIIDLIYDHLLAKMWEELETKSLTAFVAQCYNELNECLQDLPESVQFMVPRMQANKRLESYATLDGLLNTLQSMAVHTSLPDKGIAVMQVLEQNSALYEVEFLEYWPIITAFAENEFKLLNTRI